MQRCLGYHILTHDVGRQISDEEWQEVEPIHIDTWHSISLLLDGQLIEYSDSLFQLNVNFGTAIDDLSHRLGIMKRLVIDGDQSAGSDFRHDEICLLLTFTETSSSLSHFSKADDLAEYIVFETFLILNIASPGCCDFSNARISRHPKHFNIYGNEIDLKINLSGRSFEIATYQASHLPWLKVERVSVIDVYNCIQRACPRFTMLPDNPSAKALFALQHLARGEAGPPSIIWIFYGLESLFQCRPGENFRALVTRASSLLELNDENQLSLKKRLRVLYDLRSSIIHGGHQVSHPLYNGLLTSEQEDHLYRYSTETDFGVALLLMCIQRLIRLGWTFPTFSEIIQGST